MRLAVNDVLMANPYFAALETVQAELALGVGTARRFPADVIPFGGVRTPDAEGMASLRDLLAPGESIYMTGAVLASVPGLEHVEEFGGLQMMFEGDVPAALEPGQAPAIRELSGADAAAMVGLTNVAFPGFFRARTYVLGNFFGIELGGQLIAMAGERLALPGLREISTVCTHPEHRGRGYARLLIEHVLRLQAAAGLRSFLQLAAANTRALALYEQLGFRTLRPLVFNQVRRSA